jgi:hypothetical protein
MKNELFGNFSKKMFWQCTRLNFDTSCALIRVVGPSFERKNTNMKKNIHVEVNDVLPTSFIDSNVKLRWKQWKSKELRHTPWLVALWR